MLIVVSSMEQELAGLRKQLGRGWKPGGTGGLPERIGTFTVNLGVIGLGKQAAAGLRSIFGDDNGIPGRGVQRPVGLVLLGVAGAVGPDLETGDLVLSSRYYCPHLNANSPAIPLQQETRDSGISHGVPATAQEQSEAKSDFLAPDPKLWQWAIAAGRNLGKPVVYADSLTVDQLVTSPNSKRDIGSRYPVGIVNMEDYWAASVAQEVGLPFISVRAILDPAHQALPGYLSGIAGSPSRALLSFVAMPWRLPTLIGLSRQMGIAQRALTDFALNFLTQVAHSTSPTSNDAAVGVASVPTRSATE